MPPRTRTRATKASKENIGVKEKNKPRTVSKAPRKVLGDKTNSASDENISVEVPTQSKIAVTQVLEQEVEKNVRPRRDRRLPTRYVENKLLTNLSNSKDGVNVTSIPVNVITPVKINDTPSKTDEPRSSPFKTPSRVESSLVANRPKRICRLPTRFDDHSTSPNKYIPIKPSNASTPIQQSKARTNKDDKANECGNKLKISTKSSRVDNKPATHTRPVRAAKNAALQKKLSDSSTNNSSPDTNNNPKGRTLRAKKTSPSSKVPQKASPDKVIVTKKLRDKVLSFKVFEDKKKPDDSNTSNLDVYEFTYDPNEEPKPLKKKRNNVTKKRPPKPKVMVFKSNYDQNMNKALAVLKSAVSKNTPPNTAEAVKPTTQGNVNIVATDNNILIPSNTNNVDYTNVDKEKSIIANETDKKFAQEGNYHSIRVEDIAADIEPSMVHEDINYSPVHSPSKPQSPELTTKESQHKPVHVNDPLNLQEDFSFFDEQPVASSSMNMSVRNPLASPWRVEFGSLPIKWPVNTYVKPNMTPAVESSFISSSDSIKKKHVYTNIMVPPANDILPDVATNTSNWRQTSIISFYKEVAEKNARKKRGRSVSPTKFNSLFEDAPNATNVDTQKTKKPTKKATENKDITPEDNIENVLNDSNKHSEDKENSKESVKENRKRKNVEVITDKPAKSPRRQKDKDSTYFGFDDSENQGQENASPVKANNQVRTLRSGRRPALQEVNSQTGPMRAALPATKTKIASSEAVNKVYENLKSAADAPSFPEREDAPEKDSNTNIDDEILNDDSQSVHLFEDIEVVHHLKPTRKSYSKPKKVKFRQRSLSDNESPSSDVIEQNESSEEDDLADLSFEVPNVKEKKVTKKKKPKKLMSKKEEREVEEWAAGFNSMCEDIEEFPLLVE